MQKEFILGIGSQRAGSTFLARLLDQHPKIAIHPLKELHYFDTLFNIRKEQTLKDFSKAQLTREIDRLCDADSYQFIDPRWRWYLRSNFRLLTTSVSEIDYFSLFKDHENLVNKNIQYIGESTPEYMLLNDNEVANIKDVVGDARVFLMCRNPKKRIISSFRLMIEYNQQQKTVEELDTFLGSLIESKNIWIQNQINYNSYRTVYERYSKYFDSVTLIAYDDVIDDPGLILKKISDRLGLVFNTPKMINFFDQKVNSLKVHYSPSRDVEEKLDTLLGSLCAESNELLGRVLKR